MKKFISRVFWFIAHKTFNFLLICSELMFDIRQIINYTRLYFRRKYNSYKFRTIEDAIRYVINRR